MGCTGRRRGVGPLAAAAVIGSVLLAGAPAAAAERSVAPSQQVAAAPGREPLAADGGRVPGWMEDGFGALALGTVVLGGVVGTVGTRRRRRVRRHRARLREVGFRPGAQREVVVPAGPGGRPGERLVAPSRSPQVGVVGTDGSRTDATVVLTERGSRMVVVCHGPAADHGDPETHLTDAVERLRRHGRRLGTTTETKIGGEAAVVARLVRPDGAALLEHRFVREGWLFGVAVESEPGDAAAAEAVARDVLDTWEWLDANG